MSWLLFQSGVEAGTMTLAALLATRWFGPEAWGQLGVLLSGVLLVTAMGDGFWPTIIKYVSEARATDNPAAPRIGWRAMGWSVAALSSLGILVALAGLIGFSQRITFTWVFLSLLLAIGRGWRASFDGIYRGLQYFRTVAVAGSVTVSLTAAALIFFSAMGYRVSTWLAVMVVGIMANCLWLTVSFRRRYFKDSPKTITTADLNSPDFFRYSMPLVFRGLATFLFLKINILMLGIMASDYDAGQFRLTDQFLTIPSLVLSSVLAAVSPRIVASQLAGPHHLELLLSRVYGLMLALTAPLALFFWFNKPILQFFFPAYAPASTMLTYFAPAMMAIGVGFAASLVPVQAGKPGLAMVITVVSGFGNVVAAYIGIKLGGVYGLALGSAIVHFLTYTVGTAVIHKAFGLRFRIRFS